jgi:hypothetical protein
MTEQQERLDKNKRRDQSEHHTEGRRHVRDVVPGVLEPPVSACRTEANTATAPIQASIEYTQVRTIVAMLNGRFSCPAAPIEEVADSQDNRQVIFGAKIATIPTQRG